MPPKPFYEVPTGSYLFSEKLGEKLNKHEEPVRQWVLFELLSTYGVSILHIDIERRARIGSKTYPADVVILRDGCPYVVIECKRPDDKKITPYIKQAVSYANDMGAQFVVYTNSFLWIVKRKIGDEWVDVPDINKYADSLVSRDLETLLSDVSELKPIFYWLHNPVPDKYAQHFLKILQSVLSAWIHFGCFDSSLLSGIDHLLRVASSEIGKPDDHYETKKIFIAYKDLMRYFEKIDFKPVISESDPVGYPVDEVLDFLNMDFDELAKNSKGIKYPDIHLIGFARMILIYTRNSRKSSKHLEIPEGVIDQLQLVLEPVCRLRLNVDLPDKLQDISTLRLLCNSEWQEES